MATIKRQALVEYTPAQMFDLVQNVAAYPEFLPWCSGATEHTRNTDEVKATVEISKGAVHKSFTTINRLQHNKMIEMRLLEGPFKHLEGFWRFESLQDGEACKVSLDLEFDFTNKLVSLAIAPVFTSIADSLVDAFVERAEQYYA